MAQASDNQKKRTRLPKWVLLGALGVTSLPGGGIIYIYSPWFFVHWVPPTLTDPASSFLAQKRSTT